jgi:hypothetical protein
LSLNCDSPMDSNEVRLIGVKIFYFIQQDGYKTTKGISR